MALTLFFESLYDPNFDLRVSDINISPTHFIFKSTIRFIGPTLDPTNSMVNLKLG
jgi:hypothetical protein